MGNWRRVQIIGTCDSADVPKLREALKPTDDYSNWHCLMNGGLCGLPPWASEQINVVGNLAERDYTPHSVAETLLKLLGIAPSLDVKVHCGGDYESDTCINTVTARSAPLVAVLEPEVATIPEISADQMNGNLFEQLTRSRFRG